MSEDSALSLNKIFNLPDTIETSNKRIKLNQRSQLEILNEALKGKTTKQICERYGIEPIDFSLLLKENERFKNCLNMMRDEGAEWLADRLVEIPDEYDSKDAKILSDNIKWLLSKRYKSRYGESYSVKVEHEINVKEALEEARSRVVKAKVTKREDME